MDSTVVLLALESRWGLNAVGNVQLKGRGVEKSGGVELCVEEGKIGVLILLIQIRCMRFEV